MAERGHEKGARRDEGRSASDAAFGLRAQSFADPKDKTGTDHPLLVVKASFDDGKKNESASIGREGANTFASRPDEPGASKLDTAEVDGILKDLDALK